MKAAFTGATKLVLTSRVVENVKLHTVSSPWSMAVASGSTVTSTVIGVPVQSSAVLGISSGPYVNGVMVYVTTISEFVVLERAPSLMAPVP